MTKKQGPSCIHGLTKDERDRVSKVMGHRWHGTAEMLSKMGLCPNCAMYLMFLTSMRTMQEMASLDGEDFFHTFMVAFQKVTGAKVQSFSSMEDMTVAIEDEDDANPLAGETIH